MKKISVLILLIFCLLLLSGCWDKREIEDNTFVVLLGIDKAEDNDIIVTIAFPLTQTEGGGPDEGMDNGSGNYSVMSIKTPNVVEGLTMFGTKISGPLALHSVKTIVISQEIAQEDILRRVFLSWRDEEIRNTTNVLISECTATEFIEARIKESPIDPLRQEELLLEQANNNSYYKPIQFLELLSNLESGSGDGLAMYGGANTISEDDQLGENKNQISGLAVFHGAKMVGVLNPHETQTYSMLIQSKTKKVLSLPDPLNPESIIVVEILPVGKNKIVSAINNDIPNFNIDVNLKCTVEYIHSDIDYSSPENYNILKEHIQQICREDMMQLINKVQKEYNADILKLGNKLAYHFTTIAEWERYSWSEKYEGAEINLNVNVEIARTGIMMH